MADRTAATAKRPVSYEVHEHCLISGPRASGIHYHLKHSHEGGNAPHQHSDTGPASFTIDKDEWFRATGLRGGGRKKFTKRPNGEQLPIRELANWQKIFDVVICDPPRPPGYSGEGPGVAPVRRMILTFGMTARVRRA
jgi:hypothetical protein